MPKGTSPEIIDYYAALFEKAAKDPEFVTQMNAKGTSVKYKDPTDYRLYFEDTFGEWKRIATEVGMYKGN